MRRKLKTLVILFLGFGIKVLHAQEAIVTAGGNASGGGGTCSYSIGQLAFIATIATNGSASQGVQQSFDISVVNALENASDISLQCLIFPNPVTNYLTLKIGRGDYKNLTYRLYDINGKLLADKKIGEDETIIATNNLVPAIYVLKVIEDNHEIKSFKIIKK
jgi:hypothetical protein